MLDRVVNAFLEDQIRLASLICIHDNAILRAGRSKVEFDVLRIRQFGAEPADSLHEVTKTVFGGIDSPYHVAH